MSIEKCEATETSNSVAFSMPIAKHLSIDQYGIKGYVREGKIFLKLEVFVSMLKMQLHWGFRIED